jgi:EAL domain-containing protein (putative c-di-GMP-specific phosphodiesterase class I)
VAEGVESEAQRDFLLANGCESMQGFLFGKPVPPSECASWLPHVGAPLPVVPLPSLPTQPSSSG